MISAVLDTNVLASGTLRAANPPGLIINAWRDGRFLLMTSDHIIKELEHVLQKPYFQKYISNEYVYAFIELLRSEALVSPITKEIHGVATHPEDDLTLATATSANADYLVTGDQHLLAKVGDRYQGVSLVTPKDFLIQLNSVSL
jgi:putative PIN family toxin of toxin-antitoxin system